MQRRLTRDELADMFSSIPAKDEEVGIEVENGLVDPVTGCSISYDGQRSARSLLEAIAQEFNGYPLLVNDGEIIGVGLPGGANFTLETGGALEYASSPAVGLTEVIRSTHEDLRRVAVIADRFGIALLSGACLPFTAKNQIPWIPKPRVEVMRNYFDRLGEPGMYGEEVMGLTLSTQTSLDYVSGQDLFEKMRLHVLAAPIIAALSVNSPIAEGDYTGAMSRRMQYWRKFNPQRCGVLGFVLNEDASVPDIINWAIELPMIYRHVDGAPEHVHSVAPGRSFADIMHDGFGDGTWPSREDFRLHLCQLWPHVRPRPGLLELRASDGLPWPHFSATPALWVGLTYDAEIRRQAAACMSDLTVFHLENSIDDIAAKGLQTSIGMYEVKDLARQLLRLARRGLQKRVAAHLDTDEVLSYLEPLEQVSDREETFAEQCIESWEGELGKSPAAYVNKYRIPVTL